MSWNLNSPAEAHYWRPCPDPDNFHHPSQLFSKVVDGSEIKKWLEGREEAPAESDVCNDKKPPFNHLLEILDGKKKRVTNHKRKQKNEVVVEGKGKEKAQSSRQERVARRRLALKNIIKMMTSKCNGFNHPQLYN